MEQLLKVTKFVEGKTYFTHNTDGTKKTFTDKATFVEMVGDGVEVFEEQAAPSPTSRPQRPQRKRAESWDAAKAAQDERFAENLGVPSNIASKGVGFEFTGILDNEPPIQEFTETGKVRYQKVSAKADIDGKATPFCLLYNAATQTGGSEVKVKVVALDKTVAISGIGLEQM